MKLLLLFSVLCFAASTKDSYRFVILGDRTSGARPGIYERMVARAVELKPDFATDVGDHVEGYQHDTSRLSAQWAEVEKALQPLTAKLPYHVTVGNHDISFPDVSSWYEGRVGKRYYSYDFSLDHFVVIDNSRELTKDEGLFYKYDTLQWQWLKEDLAKNKGKRNIFVFYHKPVWDTSVTEPRMDSLHALFKANNVKYVFNGHYHNYQTDFRDGVNYVVVGSSGGEIEPGRGACNIFHFLEVDVSKKGVTYHPVLMDGTLLSPLVKDWNKVDQVNETLEWLKTGVRATPVTQAYGSAGRTVSYVIEFNNPTSRDIKYDLKPVEDPDCNWTFSTPLIQSLVLKPKESKTYHFNCTYRTLIPSPDARVTGQSLKDSGKAFYSEAFIMPVVFREMKAFREKQDSLFAKTRNIASHYFGTGTPAFDSAWIGFTYNDSLLKFHFVSFDPHPDSLGRAKDSRDFTVSEKTDRLVLYLAVPGAKDSSYYNIVITADGAIRDVHNRPQSFGGRNVDWNGTTGVSVKILPNGFGGSIEIPWKALGLSKPERLVFNVRNGCVRLNKKNLPNAYQEPYDTKAEAMAPLILEASK